MTSEQWMHVFTLLAIIVVADERVYKEEVDCFVAQVDILKADINGETLVTPKLAFDWFVAQKNEIQAKLKSDEAEFFVIRTIQQLLDFPDHAALLRCMQSVSMSDEDFHIQEKTIIELAAGHWGITLESNT